MDDKYVAASLVFIAAAMWAMVVVVTLALFG